MTEHRVLIVEDVRPLAAAYAAFLQRAGMSSVISECGEDALDRLAAERFDAVVLDVNLPGISGQEVMRAMRERGFLSEVIVITADGSISLAVDIMRGGAADFLVKPFNAERLRSAVNSAIGRRGRSCENLSINGDCGITGTGGFIGGSPPMQSVYRTLKSAAPSGATVFVTGESGTGKELCAEALHKMSKRANGPLITLNCAAIPRDLIESELFGHVKGAFTGAGSERKGAALQADGGTLFLDEICEMDLPLQSKLLRFVQTRKVQRLGEDRLRACDARIVCATNRNPQAEVAAGRFREDLFYRLHVIPLEMPPLRQRGEDIMLIANSFLSAFSREDQKSFSGFAPEARASLLAYGWPGNVRQLQNVIRNIVVLNDGDTVLAGMLPAGLLTDRMPCGGGADGGPDRTNAVKPLENVIREKVQEAIAVCGGSIPRAAAALGVSPSTLYRRIEGWHSQAAA